VKCDEGRPSCRHCKESGLRTRRLRCKPLLWLSTSDWAEALINFVHNRDGIALILQKLQQMDDRMMELQDEQAKAKQLLSDCEQG
jgi:hypothetical protein